MAKPPTIEAEHWFMQAQQHSLEAFNAAAEQNQLIHTAKTAEAIYALAQGLQKLAVGLRATYQAVERR